MAETALPGLAFVVAYTVTGQDTNLSAYVALGLAGVLAAARLARRETPRHALSGLFGVALAAFVATRSGKAENFFLPGLIFNAGYAAAFAISVLARYPIVGYLATQIDGSAKTAWRKDRPVCACSTRPAGCGRACSWSAWPCSCRCTWPGPWWRWA